MIREHQATDNEHASDGRHRSRDADVSGILDLGLILTSSRTFPCAMPPPRASNGVPFPSTRGCRLLIGACNLDVVLDSRALQAAKEPPVQQLSDFSVIFGPFLAHFSAPVPPTHAMRLCSTPCPCVSDADWMLIGCRLDAGWFWRSDGVTGSRLQANPKAKMLAHAATMAAATAAAVASVIRHSTKPATPEPSAMDAFFVGIFDSGFMF